MHISCTPAVNEYLQSEKEQPLRNSPLWSRLPYGEALQLHPESLVFLNMLLQCSMPSLMQRAPKYCFPWFRKVENISQATAFARRDFRYRLYSFSHVPRIWNTRLDSLTRIFHLRVRTKLKTKESICGYSVDGCVSLPPGFPCHMTYMISGLRKSSKFLSSKMLQDISRFLVSLIAAGTSSLKQADLLGNRGLG